MIGTKMQQLRPAEACSSSQAVTVLKRQSFFARFRRETQERQVMHHMVRDETPLRLLHCGRVVLLECNGERWDVRDLQVDHKAMDLSKSVAIFA
jgi:hypothetical protein